MVTYIAQDTFVAETADGAQVRVCRGEAFPDRHPLVKMDQAGAGVLFKKMDMGDETAPVKAPRSAGKGA